MLKKNGLKNKARKILILRKITDAAAHIFVVDVHTLARFIGRVETDLVEHTLHHGLQAPRADILDIVIHFGCNRRNSVYSIFGKIKRDIFGVEKRNILLNQARFGLSKNALEILTGKRF